jgi:hypothetical protein
LKKLKGFWRNHAYQSRIRSHLWFDAQSDRDFLRGQESQEESEKGSQEKVGGVMIESVVGLFLLVVLALCAIFFTWAVAVGLTALIGYISTLALILWRAVHPRKPPVDPKYDPFWKTRGSPENGQI